MKLPAGHTPILRQAKPDSKLVSCVIPLNQIWTSCQNERNPTLLASYELLPHCLQITPSHLVLPSGFLGINTLRALGIVSSLWQPLRLRGGCQCLKNLSLGRTQKTRPERANLQPGRVRVAAREGKPATWCASGWSSYSWVVAPQQSHLRLDDEVKIE